MILSLKVTRVLRVLLSMNRWAAKENKLCSIIWDEQVSNLQCSAVMMIALGIVLALMMGVAYYLGILGLVMIWAGKDMLQGKDGEVSQ